MALDVDRLRAGLTEYRKELAGQRQRLRQNHDEISRAFQELWSVYGGQMAEEFRQRWGATSEWFEQYTKTTERLDEFLKERVEHLKHL